MRAVSLVPLLALLVGCGNAGTDAAPPSDAGDRPDATRSVADASLSGDGGVTSDAGGSVDAGDARDPGGAVDASSCGPVDWDAGAPAVGACAVDLPAPVMTAPIVDVKKAFGARGDGKTDDTVAIQAALDSMTGGGTLVFAPGTYIYGGSSGSEGVLHVRQPNVAMWGYGGAELRSNNVDSQEIVLAAPGAAIYGFLLTAPQFARQTAPNNNRIDVESSGNSVVDNHIDGGAAAGIFVFGGDHFLVARNLVENTEADSIHMTQNATPSHDGRVLQNSVRAPGPYWGDDEIAVIGYRTSTDSPDSMTNANYDILIECNDLEAAGWGNGVDIGGAKDVTIRRNVISGIYHAGGIKLGAEASYPTFSVMNVLVQNNRVSHIETTGTTKDGTRTGFGGFEIAARDPGSSVRHVLAENDTVDDTYSSGIRFDGILCDLGFSHTALRATQAGTFGALSPSFPGGCTIACQGVTGDGDAAVSSFCTTTTLPTDVTGSSIADPGPALVGPDGGTCTP